ncbi:MAG: hypothetical protein AAFZ01_10760 [Pseudomonadota bacterium]
MTLRTSRYATPVTSWRAVRIAIGGCFAGLAMSSGAHAGLGGTDARIGEATSVTFVSPSLSKSYQLQAPMRHLGPVDLPAGMLEHQAIGIPDKMTPPVTLAGAHAPLHRDQIFWRYGGERADLLPRFRAQQQRRHDALTGPGQFVVMILAFSIMSALTAALWLQIGRQSRDMRTQTAKTRRLT